jgi:hypothetical protein
VQDKSLNGYLGTRGTRNLKDRTVHGRLSWKSRSYWLQACSFHWIKQGEEKQKKREGKRKKKKKEEEDASGSAPTHHTHTRKLLVGTPLYWSVLL